LRRLDILWQQEDVEKLEQTIKNGSFFEKDIQQEGSDIPENKLFEDKRKQLKEMMREFRKTNARQAFRQLHLCTHRLDTHPRFNGRVA